MREYTPGYVTRYPEQAVPQVQSVLAKLTLCRTAALGEHVFRCPECDFRLHVPNSCVDRHCPLCSGARRAEWLTKRAELLLPKITYFQVVFTLPELLWDLMLGNRRETYGLLFRAAWAALGEVLREELGCEPAALLVLHTWNQRLEHYPHLHGLVPGGGPSLDGQRWVASRHRRQRRRRKPFLVDNQVLGARFRTKFLSGLRRLHRKGNLKLTGSWSRMQEPGVWESWLKSLATADWVVYVQPPPDEKMSPEQVLKYLARYLTGGPISDRRLLAHEDGWVTFWARSRDKRRGNPQEPCRLSGVEFTRCWALHILPKGFVKSRAYGGYSGRNRAAYLARCRELLGVTTAEQTPLPTPGDEVAEAAAHVCPHCQTPLECLAHTPRPSWRDVFGSGARPAWYEPFRRRAARRVSRPSDIPPDG